jgi:hypothetical protein
MGFEFAETMSGTVEWDAHPGQQHPFSFEIRAHAGSTREHLKSGVAHVNGVVHCPPKAESADIEGTITIRPLGQRIIRYELSFLADDGKRYEMVGQRTFAGARPSRPLRPSRRRSSTRTTVAWLPV